MKRKEFIRTIGLSAAMGPAAVSLAFRNPSFQKSEGFFTIRKVKGRFFLLDPDGNRFFSMGINHVDPAGLRYPENAHIWHEKYDNSMEQWLRESVRPDLLDWGFNTMGWNQEVITREPENHRHSRSFTAEEYRWLDMPYCHMLPFADFHQWEAETINPDFYGSGFSEWCDYVARDQASRLAEDPNLIGYWYIDCPTWIHTRKESEWKGPLFDPERLNSEAGRKELSDMATRYYKVTHDAIRRYDKNHLIFGDRYEAKSPLAEEVLKAAIPFTDALCFQHFGQPHEVAENLSYWHGITGMPTLLADGAFNKPLGNTGYKTHNPEKYAEMYRLIRLEPSCIGYHLCGAYLANRVRKKGLIDENEQPHKEAVAGLRKVHREMREWTENF